ncbi:aminoacyl tRNA synthase complex-interacting multifunctional protein 1 [Arapaima gigas]
MSHDCSLMFLSRSLIRMSGHAQTFAQMEQRATEADHLIAYLKQQVQLLKEKAMVQATQREEKRLLAENAKLKQDIEELKGQLEEKERQRGVLQVAMPSEGTPAVLTKPTPQETASTESTISVTPKAPGAPQKDMPPKENEAKKKKEKSAEKKEKKQAAAAPEPEPLVDVSRLDLRVGKIISAEKHPDADSLYVEQVDVGEATPRTVVSGLVKHVPLDQMQNRMAVLLCNLKPAKMRGVVSQAMVMCASSPDKVEILDPPPTAVPGDRITFQGFPGEPDKELNPKKKVWEQVQPDLRTNDQCVATYKGVPFQVAGKGVCKAQTMTNSGIK